MLLKVILEEDRNLQEKFWKIEGFIAPMIVPKHATRSFDSDDECEYVVNDEEDDAEDDAEEEEEE